MSQKDDSENDIWEYKPLEKKKKRQKSPPPAITATKRRCTLRKTCKKDSAVSSKTAESGRFSTPVHVGGHGGSETQKRDPLPSELCPTHEADQRDSAAEGPSSGDFCPMCQMPFSILVVQSQRWHVAECLDTSRDKCEGTDLHTLDNTSGPLSSNCVCVVLF